MIGNCLKKIKNQNYFCENALRFETVTEITLGLVYRRIQKLRALSKKKTHSMSTCVLPNLAEWKPSVIMSESSHVTHKSLTAQTSMTYRLKI